MSESGRGHDFRRAGSWTTLIGLIAIVAVMVLPASASAAPCPVNPGNSTTWIGGSGNFGEDGAWSNGTPSGSCDVVVTPAGSPTITMTGGASMKSLILGGVGSTPTLVISAESPNTNLNATTTGIDIAAGAAVVLTCPALPTGCLGGSGGGAILNSGTSTIDNAGSITVAAASGTGARIDGNVNNTGSIQFAQSAAQFNGLLLNQGAIGVADGKVFRSTTSHCGDSTGTVLRNDTGGTIATAGTGTVDVVNYEQGNGSTSGANPVQIPCGSLKYSGSGASKVRAYGGFTLSGEMQAGQSLTVSAESSNTNAVLAGNFTNKGSITLTCPVSPGECNGGAGGGAGFNVAANTFTNAGTFTVAAASGTGAGLGANTSGSILNTGSIQFDQSAGLGGPVTNKGSINIATGETATSSGSSCGDTGGFVKNDTGGQINATGTGTLSVLNYEQGAGTTSGTTPVQIPCGSLKYTGNGAGKVQANGGFTLTGEMQAGQSLTVNDANAHLGGNFTNKGSITLTCPGGGCSGGSGGGSGFNVNDKDFVNAGTFTVAAASGTGAGLGANFEGTIVNTGTMQYDQSAGLGGPVTNKGLISVADGKTALSNTSSCGDTGGSVKNDTGGQINATGTGTLSAVNYEQGAGTTAGAAPVTVNCGYLKYTGAGASTVRVNSSATMTGNLASGQTLSIAGGINAPPSLTNAGTITFDQSGSSPTLNVSGTLTNTGKIALSGPSANTANLGGGGTIEQTGAAAEVVVPAGTKFNVGNPLLLKAGKLTGAGQIVGSVNNQGGVVSPGASPGTLTLSGNYTQGTGGRLDVEVAGTGAGQFDKLAVGGNATLGGTLTLLPIDGYANLAALGDSLEFLSYGGTRTDQFGQETTSPSLACPKRFTTGYDDGGKAVGVTVTGDGASCPLPPPPPSPRPPEAEPVPNTTLGKRPSPKIKTTKSKVKVSFSFSADLAAATFQCKLDKGAYVTCVSPASYKVKPGKHTFSVRAVGASGTDATPESFSFKVVKKKKKKS